jgi:hypothetical protein
MSRNTELIDVYQNTRTGHFRRLIALGVHLGISQAEISLESSYSLARAATWWLAASPNRFKL